MEGLRTNRDLYCILRSHKKDLKDYTFLYQKMQQLLKERYMHVGNLPLLKTCCKKFTFKLKQKWIKSSYTENKFIVKNKNWLDQKFIFPNNVVSLIPKTSKSSEMDERQISSSSVSIRKGKKAYAECSTREKIRRSRSLVENFSLKELLDATNMSLRRQGMHQTARFLQYLEQKQYCKLIASLNLKYGAKPKKINPERALCLFITAELSKFQYINIRNEAIKCQINSLPSYAKLIDEKKQCYPPKNAITITEAYAKVDLQSLLDHTVSRILKTIAKPISSTRLELICKWGCDGAAGQSRYKQLQLEESNIDDTSVFCSSLVPLLLKSTSSSQIVWQNPQPSSTWFCRPLKFQFVKESEDVIKREISDINNEISNLKSYASNNIEIKYCMLLTMVDNKICNTMTNTKSAMRCYICKATPTEMNNLGLNLKKNNQETNYSFGISSLHAWIRCFECLIHVSYNLPFKKWIANTPEMKKMKEEKKAFVQKQFKDRLGLYIDYVKQGWGSSNDGNTARKFFANAEISANITGIDEALIKRFYVILQVISSRNCINIGMFKDYAYHTAELFVKKYGWYYMPASVHKILIHGAEIAKHALLPIGQLSEEALESRHKDFKKYRERHTRKMSRITTNQDLIYRLLLTSDPYIGTIRQKCYNNPKVPLDPEAQALIVKK